MIRTAAAAIALSLVMVLSGYALFGGGQWWFGLGAGAAVAAAWTIDRRVGSVLAIASAVLLLIGLVGGADGLPASSRAFFNGATLGLLLGLLGAAAVTWKRLRPFLVAQARRERVVWLLNLLGEKGE